jgi:Lrp/AsnC family transcriptional regulator for asnA, asnC and gidA
VSSADIERRILRLLESDAQASIADLADRAGVSKPTVRKYIDKLEAEGVIVGYGAEVDPKKLSSQTIALVGMDVESERYVEVTRALQEVDAIETLFTSSGDHMLMAEVRAPDGDALGDVISDTLLAVDGVTAAHPAILQERLK